MLSVTSGRVQSRVQPRDLLIGDSLEHYQAACISAGAKSAPGSAFTISNVALPELLARLADAGFEVKLDETTSKALSALEERRTTERVHAQAHIMRANAALAREGKQLWSFQIADIPTIATSDRLVVGHDMGLGKTGMVLSAAPVSDKPGGIAGGITAVVPSNVTGVWRDQAELFRPDLTIVRVQKPGEWRWAEPGELLLGTFGRLPALEAERYRIKREVLVDPTSRKASKLKGNSATDMARNCPMHQILVADEGHYLKNPDSQRTKRFRTLARAVLKNHGKVWIITGTPYERPEEFRAILVSLGLFGKLFGKDREAQDRFAKMFGGRRGYFGGWTWPDPPWVSPELVKMCAPYVLIRKREEVFPDMPPKVRQMIPIPVDKREDKSAIKNAAKALSDAGLEMDTIEDILGGDLDRNLELERKADFSLMSTIRRDLSIAKLPHVLSLVEELECEGPLVVGSCHRVIAQALAGRPGWVYVTGGMTEKDRDENIRAFQSGEKCGMALTYSAGGVGLTLSASWRMVMADLPWNSADLLQAEDRLRPHLQTQACHYFYTVYDHPVERRAAEVLLRKVVLREELESGVMDAWAGGIPDQNAVLKDSTGRILRGPHNRHEKVALLYVLNAGTEASARWREKWRELKAFNDLQWQAITRMAEKIREDR